ncbi:bifunctional DNA-formamidopyrimidine glycosylase/DNA-(apurinic or apyrimidinic site) lyase [Tibeticola sp.]|uniref:bifunctional DNA-formamidopyrimidine glycosylase/DNA-(apurinic or apyrimidinic site) lyase n=1 Tax=Tibeticola sp. TaxID=2005368 RepID=UPI00258B9F0A|nr:bifunctional DNA-formamidopyrimidine glycosylase/DNA-(apurinic or apyrimidinic site) lyase [Tibeticola sp.]MCI4440140.1 bifunctional DNA-formamidopyrimidine glycosylase/DNA-(apurinic or apyrimidinic site) lyase [Tibeticola sp.]
MPELPEVEVTRAGIAPKLAGRRIVGVRLGKPLRWPLGVAAEELIGQVIGAVRRRGKYLLVDLDGGGVLVVHLGMSGRLAFYTGSPPAGPHDHFDLQVEGGVLRLHDPRRFGAVVYGASPDAPMVRKLIGHLGPEPLSGDFDAHVFHLGLRQRRTTIKQALMAGDLVVGVGNIYASEALFEAGIRPTTPAHRLSRQRAERLHAAIRRVLQRALDSGGSTLRDFLSAEGQPGHFQQEAAVYGRAGQACPRCGHTVRSVVLGQRSTFYCPRCQT